MLLRALALWLVSTQMTSPAFAASSGGTWEFIWSWVNLLMLLGVLFYFARKPIGEYLRERKHGIERNLEDSARLLQEAEQHLAEWKERVANLQAEVERIRQTARERAGAERDRILEEARAGGERIQRDAEAAVEQEIRRAREQLREEAAELAVEIAAGLIQESVNEADQRRLLDEFVARVESTNVSTREN